MDTPDIFAYLITDGDRLIRFIVITIVLPLIYYSDRSEVHRAISDYDRPIPYSVAESDSLHFFELPAGLILTAVIMLCMVMSLDILFTPAALEGLAPVPDDVLSKRVQARDIIVRAGGLFAVLVIVIIKSRKAKFFQDMASPLLPNQNEATPHPPEAPVPVGEAAGAASHSPSHRNVGVTPDTCMAASRNEQTADRRTMASSHSLARGVLAAIALSGLSLVAQTVLHWHRTSKLP